MTRRATGGRSRKDVEDDDGDELWDIIKSRVEPLKGRRDRVHHAAVTQTRAGEPTPKPAARKPDRQRPQSPISRHEPAPPSTSARTPPPFDIERKKARRLAGGKLPIEAVLDLHGMRQDEARAALHRFLHQAQARRIKFVKIITGKGAAGRQDQVGGWREPEPGVLRRQVPRWLAEPSLRPLIVGTSEAGPRHGGSGALYVEVRRREMKAR
ncbi:MAG: DNA mismatch repair protein MutS [Hyphomicrobiaceae bacterium]|nr:MAG: DNA mismatch repair protein MutS [Hyphomicrobiaceae bacterium]